MDETTYESLTDKRGRRLIYAVRQGEKKLTSKAKIPEGAFIRDLDADAGNLTPPVVPPMYVEAEEYDPEDRSCMLRDGEAGTYRRVVSGEVRYLCREHYFNMSLGELVQFLRDKQVA